MAWLWRSLEFALSFAVSFEEAALTAAGKLLTEPT